jgi:hypothetical protein
MMGLLVLEGLELIVWGVVEGDIAVWGEFETLGWYFREV